MIRSTSHLFKEVNAGKRERLAAFIGECRRVAGLYLDFLWDSRVEWDCGDKRRVLDVASGEYDAPSMYSTVLAEHRIDGFASPLSARARKCVMTQVCGMVNAALRKQAKRLRVFDAACAAGKFNASLWSKIERSAPVKPSLRDFAVELNSICANWLYDESSSFTGYLELSSIGTDYGKLRLPVKFHRHARKYREDWKMLPSFLVSEFGVDIRWSKEAPSPRTEGRTVGADQGLKTVVTLSDGQTTKKDSHGWDLDKILDKMARKRKGSKAFEQAQEHRKNHINWAVKQLNLDGVKQLNLEKIWNIGYRHGRSRKLSSWTNTLIRDRLMDRCARLGVRVVHQSSAYRSQRCNACGLVRKSSRKGKEYGCPNCGSHIDADLNAAMNHETALPDIPWNLRKLNLNRKGFFWTEEGFRGLDGAELAVPLDPEMKVI